MTDLNRETYRRISVITPTFDRPESALRTAVSVLADKNSNLTYYLVSQDKSGATKNALEQSGIMGNERFRYIFSEVAGECLARNIGMRAALKEGGRQILAGIDDDCIAPPNWASGYLGVFNRLSTDMHYGPVLEPPVAKGYVPHFLSPNERFVDPASFITEQGMSANFAITSEAYEKVGPFDELLGCGSELGGADDHDYGIRVRRAGGVVSVGPNPEVIHYGARENLDRFELGLRYARSLAALAVKHELYGDDFDSWRQRQLFKSIKEALSSAFQLRRPTGISMAAGIVDGTWKMRKYEVVHDAETDQRLLRRKS